ncbi:MAG TPA: TonB-dependent receptor [Gammaproteobacteria bacterium]|nr:TonB-dependent receptor [Gammaproteobacteria bacterium]
MSNKHRILPFSVLLVAGSLAPAHAGSMSLSPVVVTATRSPETASRVVAPVQVITRADIERSQASSLPDLLAGMPGVQVSTSGGYGKVSSLFLRGTNANQMLVLVDGVRFGSVTSGTAPWSQIPLSQIQRIEIVRGPVSSLYGANAIGGVIQIFTRKPTPKRRVTASVGGGTYRTGKASASISGHTGRTGYSLTLGHFHTDGYDVQKNGVPSGYGYKTPNQPDADGYRSNSVSGWLTHGFAGGVRVKGHFLRAQGRTDYDGSFQNATDFVNQVGGASVRVPVTGRWSTTLQAGSSLDQNDNLDNGVHSSTFNSRIDSGSWLNRIDLGRHQDLTVGADYRRESVASDTHYDHSRRHNLGAFALDQLYFGRNTLQASVRHDRNSAYGDQNTGSIAWGYRLAHGLRVTASYGSAFDAPTFNDLYYPGFSNPKLSPERSHGGGLGLKQRFSRGHWEVHAFRSDVRDLIQLAGPAFQPENVARARIDGAEASGLYRIGAWRTYAAATWLDPRDRSTGEMLARRSRWSGRAELDRKLGRLSVGTVVRARSYSYDNASNSIRLGGFTTVGLHASYSLTRHLTLAGRIANLFDRSYTTAYTYRQPGRTVFASIRYRGL